MSDKRPDFRFVGTGIGSVPFLDIEATCRRIGRWVPVMPFWPQFVRRSYLEDMIIQFSEGLPLLRVNPKERALSLRVDDREAELVTFYERFLANDVDAFAMSRDVAPGLYSLVETLRQKGVDLGPYVKGQTVGPVTFAAAIKDPTGKPILYDPELAEAMTKGLAIKALWQVRQLADSGKRPVIFLDEPYLSGFGSAFSAVQRHEVVAMLRTVIDYLREQSDATIGIHCCGNTDWSMVMEARPDIVNLDAVEYLDHFLLYKEPILGFLEGGGSVAWGIVPTANFTGEETVDSLFTRLLKGVERLQEWGLDRTEVAERALVTPACGMGTMSEEAAVSAMELLADISRRCKDWGL